MEHQFILRLPASLTGVDPKACKLVKTSAREVNFVVGGEKTYPGVIYRLPTIVESQKMVDNKLYKIADISTLIVVYEDKSFNLDDEIFKHESSGITPPMCCAKEKRFAKTAVRTEEVEKIEKKVAELLRADARAQRVEILTGEKESGEMDIDLLAAEIENELLGSGKEAETVKRGQEVFEPELEREDGKMLMGIPELEELEQKIKEKQEQYEKAVNPILKKRFEQALESLKEEYQRRSREYEK